MFEFGRRHAFIRILRLAVAPRGGSSVSLPRLASFMKRLIDAPVATLQTVARVSETCHQLRQDPRHAFWTVPAIDWLS